MDVSILENRVVRHLEKTLLAYFDYKESGACNNLYGFIAGLMRDLCGKLDVEMLRKAAEKVDGKGLDEWRSWYVDETIQRQANAIGEFAHRVMDVEAVADAGPDRKVSCELGYQNAEEFFNCWHTTHQTRLEEKDRPPLSRKFRDKRQSHSEPPYLDELYGLGWLRKKRM
jgi:hypothetical protein